MLRMLWILRLLRGPARLTTLGPVGEPLPQRRPLGRAGPGGPGILAADIDLPARNGSVVGPYPRTIAVQTERPVSASLARHRPPESTIASAVSGTGGSHPVRRHRPG